MGANYVEAAFDQWAHLPGNAFKALTRMALVVPDYKPNPRYYAGRELIAFALGCTDWRYKDEPDKSRIHRAATRRVERAIQDLVQAGAITPQRRAFPGRRAEYRLNLTPVDKSHYRASSEELADE